MKVIEFYMNKSYFADKLDIEESQFVIGDINNDFESVTFKIFIDNDAKTKNPEDSAELKNGLWNVRRQKIEGFGEEK